MIGGFVGADNVAVQLAISKLEPKSVRMILDIGTNTEVVLSDEEGSLVCSAASGPAFEGMHITFGRKADSASIDRVHIDPRTLGITFQTIGAVRPAGICGSGIVDAAAEMLKVGIIRRDGKMNEQLLESMPRLRRGPSGELEFVLVWKEETDINSDIVVTQSDVYEIQKAKAAIHAACNLLMREKNISIKDIDEVIMAGAFGQYMNNASAQIIGLLPEVPLDSVRHVGNAAGTGAKLALLSLSDREKSEIISREARYYELAACPNFPEEFVRAMFFPDIRSLEGRVNSCRNVTEEESFTHLEMLPE
jgi:uncharacterized 2Fe-2S/4Fe-4S cluster protein (DUF4445 family)